MSPLVIPPGEIQFALALLTLWCSATGFLLFLQCVIQCVICGTCGYSNKNAGNDENVDKEDHSRKEDENAPQHPFGMHDLSSYQSFA